MDILIILVLRVVVVVICDNLYHISFDIAKPTGDRVNIRYQVYSL